MSYESVQEILGRIVDVLKKSSLCEWNQKTVVEVVNSSTSIFDHVRTFLEPRKWQLCTEKFAREASRPPIFGKAEQHLKVPSATPHIPSLNSKNMTNIRDRHLEKGERQSSCDSQTPPLKHRALL